MKFDLLYLHIIVNGYNFEGVSLNVNELRYTFLEIANYTEKISDLKLDQCVSCMNGQIFFFSTEKILNQTLREILG